MTTARERGVLYPRSAPSLTRLPPPPDLADRVGWFWIPEWDLPPGESSVQELIAFPASNLVVEESVTGIAGPTTRRSERVLSGSGWAVGALLLPAAVPALLGDPGTWRDFYRIVDEPGLAGGVRAAMTASAPALERHRAALAAFGSWLRERVPAATEEGRFANAFAELVSSDHDVVRVEDAADRLGVSSRTLQRLARRYVGLSPSAMIRRRRLQEAAELLRSDPGATVASVAAEFGYADQAHLAAEFRTVLGISPTGYRAALDRT